MQCSNHLKQISLAMHNYEASNRIFPPSAIIRSVAAINTNASWSIHGRILPYLEQGSLYDRVDLSLARDDQAVISGLKIPTYSCPSDPRSDQLASHGHSLNWRSIKVAGTLRRAVSKNDRERHMECAYYLTSTTLPRSTPVSILRCAPAASAIGNRLSIVIFNFPC